MVIALTVACATGAGFAAYRHDGRPWAIVGFASGGAIFGLLLSRLRHWED